MKIKISCYFLLSYIFLFLVNYSFADTKFVNYMLTSYEQYAINNIESNCEVTNFAVVLDDQYELVEFSNNILNPGGNGVKKVYYEGTKKLFSLTIFIPLGTTNNISFNVTNTNGETSNIDISLTKPFECKKFLLPLNITSISDLYLFEDSLYGFNIGVNISNDLNIASSLKCTISYAKYCSVIKKTSSYFIYGIPLILNEMNKEKFKVVVSDLFGGEQILEIYNTIFSYSTKPSVVKSVYVTPPNNSNMIQGDLNDIKVSIQVTYSGELNAFPVVIDENLGQIIPDIGTLVLGTPEEQTILFSSYASPPKQSYTLYDVAANIEKFATFNYTFISNSGSSIDKVVNKSTPAYSVVENQETGNLLFSVYLKLSKLEENIKILPIYFPGNYSTEFVPSYPYGISKSNNNSYYELNTEGMFPNSHYGGGFQITVGSYELLGVVGNVFKNGDNVVPIPNDNSEIMKNDIEGPILRHISYQLLENSRLLITMNITDVGSGVYSINCAEPVFSLLATQALILGDINNGIYQFLINIGDLISNKLKLSAFDYMGNEGLNEQPYSFTDLNFSSVNPILQNNVTPNDITFFEFDRLEIDTSFDDLEVNLRINFTDAILIGGAIPILAPVYDIGRSGLSFYKGIYNQTSHMFDIKVNVKARERGYFRYVLFISPLYIYETDIETIFPDQKIKLNTNYVDHFPPIITKFKSLTNVNLTIDHGDEIEIGWNVEIYDYPTGLDYAQFEVISDKDLEAYKFTFKPDTSIPGSDILSTYTIKFSVKPVVDQTFYLSNVRLVDKNGYFSQYPAKQKSYAGTVVSAFFNNTFSMERNIKISLSSIIYNDIKAPTLLSLTFPTSIDSFGINRTAVFHFTIQDDLSGISKRHNPYVYIQFNYQSFVSVQSQLIDSNNVTLTNSYRAVFDFDYSVLAYGAIISINGITDNSMNIVSYSSLQLKSNGFPSSISNPIQTRPPVILEFTSLNENGGKLFLYGKEFTDSPIVYMDKGDGFNTISPSFVSNVAITLQISSVKGIELIRFKLVSKQELNSNIITVYPIVNPTFSDSNCSSLNECSGKGKCINSKCVCDTGSSGPDCSSTSKDIDGTPNETPSFNSFGSMIEINQLDEINHLGDVIKSYPLISWEGSTIKSQYQSGVNAYQYKNTLSLTGTNITIVVDIFNSSNTINFASNKISMDKGTIKYTISLDSYPFGSRLNTLQLKVNASIQVDNSTCKLNSYSLIEGTNSLEWIKLRSNNQSIYGKFIQNALIDYRSVSIQNKLLVVPTIENQQAVIGIQIPFYFQNSVLDPDFSVLVDTDNLVSNKKASCYDGSSDSNSNGLSKSKIIIISVVCSVVGVALIIITIFLITKKSSFRVWSLKLKQSIKLKKITK